MPMTLKNICDDYITNLVGKASPTTVASYKNDLTTAVNFFGEEFPAERLHESAVRDYFESRVVLAKRDGSLKSPISIAKTRRTLRQALAWAMGTGLLEKFDIPVMRDDSAAPSTTAQHTAPEATEKPAESAPATLEISTGATTDVNPAPATPDFDHPLMQEDDDDRARKATKNAKAGGKNSNGRKAVQR